MNHPEFIAGKNFPQAARECTAKEREQLTRLRQKYPAVKPAAIDLLLHYNGVVQQLAAALHTTDVLRAASFQNVKVSLRNFFTGVQSGLTYEKKPGNIILALSELSGRPASAFVDIPNERSILLQYPDAPEELIAMIAEYGTVAKLASALMKTSVFKKKTIETETVSRDIYSLRNGRMSGWNGSKEPCALVRALAELSGKDVEEFVPVLTEDEFRRMLEENYPKARPALIELIVSHRSIRKLALRLSTEDILQGKNPARIHSRLLRLANGTETGLSGGTLKRKTITFNQTVIALSEISRQPPKEFVNRQVVHEKLFCVPGYLGL
jgi:hypothetical protein